MYSSPNIFLLLLHGSTVLVGPWPPSRLSSSHIFCTHVSSSLWHPSSSSPPLRHPSTLTLVFLHSYFLLACSLYQPFLTHLLHMSQPFQSSFFISVTMSNSPYNCLTSSFVLLLQYPAIHIGSNIFLSTFLSQIRKFSHHLPLSTMLLSHTAPLVLLLFCTFLFLLSWIQLLISTRAILITPISGHYSCLYLRLIITIFCYHWP